MSSRFEDPALGIDDPDLADLIESLFEDGYTDMADKVAALRGLQDVTAKVPDAAAAYAKSRGSQLITGIDDTTRQGIADAVSAAQDDGISDAELAQNLKDSFLFDDVRAQLIARTEGQTAFNMGTLRALDDAGEQYVYVSDPDQCGQPECDVDGEIWTIDEAEADPIGHPNCGRQFRPLTDDELAATQDEGDQPGEEGVGGFSARNVGTKLLGAALSRQPFYSPDQPRDERGRWGGGTPEGKSAEKAARADSHAKAAKYHDAAAKALEGVTVKGVSLAMGHKQAAAAHRNAITAKGFGKDREYQATRHAQQQSKLVHEYTRGAFNAQLFYSEDQARDDHGRWAAGGDSRQELVEDVRQRIHDTMPPGSKLFLTAAGGNRGDELYVDGIAIPDAKQGEGHGTRAMEKILAFADAHNLKVSLSPQPDRGKKGALEKFYRGLGFHPASDARGYDPTAHGTWVRPKLSERRGKKYGISQEDIDGMPWVHVQSFDAHDVSNEPRDERGRWEDAGGGPQSVKAALEAHLVDSKSDRALTGKDSTRITTVVKGTKATGYLSVPGVEDMHDAMGLKPTLNTSPAAYQAARDHLFEKEEIRPINITNLTFTQPRVNIPRATALMGLASQLDKPVQVLKHGSDFYLMNGHHRVAAAHMAGRTTVNAHIWDAKGLMGGSRTASMWHRSADGVKLSVLLAIDPDELMTFAYDESEARDDHGRWTGSGASEAIEGIKTATPADVAAGKVPHVELGDSTKVGPSVLAQYQGDGKVHVFPGFFEQGEFGRGLLMAHEFGHEVAQRANAEHNKEMVEALRPFRTNPNDPWRYDNFAGLSSRPEEMLADIYSELYHSKAQPWEEEGGKYAGAYKFVLSVASKAGLPLPSWTRGQKFYSDDQLRGEDGRWVSEGDASHLGGTTAKSFYRDAATGERHLFKPDPEVKVLAAVAASQIARIANPKATEAQVVTIGGHTGLMQKFIPGEPLDFKNLSPDDIHQLQREHVIDWATSQHDSHPGQFIRDEQGNVVSLDKSQAWKHLGADRLDHTYHPNSRYGENPPVYNDLFRPGSPALKHLDPEAIAPTISNLAGITHEQLTQILGPYAKASGRGDAFIKAAHERLQSVGRHFGEHYAKLLGTKQKFEAAWDEDKHPRAPAGSSEGGQFVGEGSDGGGSSEPRVAGDRVTEQPAAFFKPVRTTSKDILTQYVRADVGKVVGGKVQNKDGSWRPLDMRDLTPQVQALFNQIITDSLSHATPVDDPVATILGGGPGSGKSTVARNLGFYTRDAAGHDIPNPAKNLVIVNADDLRAKLPWAKEAYDKTTGVVNVAPYHEMASLLSNELLFRAAHGGYNLMLDGTGNGNLDKLAARVETVRGAWLRTQGVYVTSSILTAEQRAYGRAMRAVTASQAGLPHDKADRRLVPLDVLHEAHMGVSKTFPKALKLGLFDTWTLYDTDGKSPVKVASGGRHGEGTIHNPELWKRFLAKGIGKKVFAVAHGEIDCEDLYRMLAEIVNGEEPSMPGAAAQLKRAILTNQVNDIQSQGLAVDVPHEIAHIDRPAPAKGEKFYSEDQPRDEDGKWTSGGGGGDAHAVPAEMNGVHPLIESMKARIDDGKEPTLGAGALAFRARMDLLGDRLRSDPEEAKIWEDSIAHHGEDKMTLAILASEGNSFPMVMSNLRSAEGLAGKDRIESLTSLPDPGETITPAQRLALALSSGMTPAEYVRGAEAAKSYSGNGYRSINAVYRGGLDQWGVDQPTRDHLQREADAFDQLLSKAPDIKGDGDIYRAMRLPRMSIPESLITEGETYTEKGFMSASSHRGFVDGWLSGKKAEDDGDPGKAYFFLHWKNAGGAKNVTPFLSLRTAEGEVNYRPGAKMKVLKVKKSGGNGKPLSYDIEMEVHP